MGNSKRLGLIIIKLGGSVVTYKDSPTPKARLSTIKNLSEELSKLHKNYQLIIVHGAGSFGHPLAKKYRLTEGLEHKDSLVGFSKTAIINSEFPLTSCNQSLLHPSAELL